MIKFRSCICRWSRSRRKPRRQKNISCSEMSCAAWKYHSGWITWIICRNKAKRTKQTMSARRRRRTASAVRSKPTMKIRRLSPIQCTKRMSSLIMSVRKYPRARRKTPSRTVRRRSLKRSLKTTSASPTEYGVSSMSRRAATAESKRRLMSAKQESVKSYLKKGCLPKKPACFSASSKTWLIRQGNHQNGSARY